MTNIQDMTTQQIICGGLILLAIIAVIFHLDTEIITAIIAGLIGFLTNSKVDQDRIQTTIQDGITETLEDIAGEDTTTTAGGDGQVNDDDDDDEAYKYGGA